MKQESNEPDPQLYFINIYDFKMINYGNDSFTTNNPVSSAIASFALAKEIKNI